MSSFVDILIIIVFVLPVSLVKGSIISPWDIIYNNFPVLMNYLSKKMYSSVSWCGVSILHTLLIGDVGK